MAYRAVVEKPQTIRALVSSTNISVVDAQLEKSAAIISARSYNASVTARVMNAIANYSNAATQIHYRKLLATDLALDPFSLNKYFRLDQAAISDAISVLSNKGLNNVAGLSDQQDLLVGKGLLNSFSMGDEALVLLYIVKAFEEIAYATDSQELSVGLVKSEALEISDITAMLASKAVIDVADILEQAAVALSKLLADSLSISDQFSKTSEYQRSFADAFVLDDFTDIGAITKSSTAAKSNVIGFSDTQSFATDKALQDSTSLSDLPSLLTSRTATDNIAIAEVFQKVTTFNREITDSAIITDVRNSFIGKALSETAAMSDVLLKDTAYNRTFADAVSFAEQYVAAFEKGLLDTATITESIQISTRSLASSVLNAGALNSTPFNN
jgi:hypothetical protein